MTTSNQKFFEIKLDTASPNECSPILTSDATKEIRLAAPTHSPLSASPVVIPICGTFVMPVPSPPTDEPIMFHVLVVATGDSFAGPLRCLDEHPQAPPPESEPLPAEATANMMVGGYFNQNLLDHVEFPLEKGVYEVTVRFQGVESNSVRIELF